MGEVFRLLFRPIPWQRREAEPTGRCCTRRQSAGKGGALYSPSRLGRGRLTSRAPGLPWRLIPVILPISLLFSCGGVSLFTGDEFLSRVYLTDPDLSALSSGTYPGVYTITPPPGITVANREAAVEVVIEDSGPDKVYGEIRIIKPEQYREDPRFLAMINTIITGNSLQVDQVSGASFSSMAVLKAVESVFDGGGM